MLNASFPNGAVTEKVQWRGVPEQSAEDDERSTATGVPPFTTIVAPFVAGDTNFGRTREPVTVDAFGTMRFTNAVAVD